MFIDTPSEELRQGDICVGWRIPQWGFTAYELVGGPSGDTEPKRAIVGLHNKGKETPLIICSHDCDLENPRNRHGILVAPILNWPYQDIGSDASLELISSRALGEGNTYAFVHLFPFNLAAVANESGTDWRVTDFSTITSVSSPAKTKATLLKTKKYELDDSGRDQFKSKLAAFFGR